jgi:hypothetical protein
MQYYFLLLSLPPVSLQARPELSFKEVMSMVLLNLSPADFEKVRMLLLPIDLYNVKAIWMGEPLNDKGNFSEKELRESLLVQDESLPGYLLDFLDRYDKESDRLAYFPFLFASLYSNQDLKGFLLEYYQFERDLRLILTALRAKKLGRNIVRELQFEDPLDPFVAFVLAQKDAEDFVPPREFDDLKSLFMENNSQPEKLHRAILAYRFKKIGEMKDITSFSSDQVLIYMAQFLIVDEYFSLDRKKGQIVVDELSQYE